MCQESVLIQCLSQNHPIHHHHHHHRHRRLLRLLRLLLRFTTLRSALGPILRHFEKARRQRLHSLFQTILEVVFLGMAVLVISACSMALSAPSVAQALHAKQCSHLPPIWQAAMPASLLQQPLIPMLPTIWEMQARRLSYALTLWLPQQRSQPARSVCQIQTIRKLL